MEPDGAFVVGQWVRQHSTDRLGRVLWIQTERSMRVEFLRTNWPRDSPDRPFYSWSLGKAQFEAATPTEQEIYEWSVAELSR